MSITFEQYQQNYGKYVLRSPAEEVLYEGFTKLKNTIHDFLDRAVKRIQETSLVTRITRVAVTALSYIPQLVTSFAWMDKFLIDIIDINHFIRGLHTIDSLLTSKLSKLSWKTLLQKISSLALFILSGITLAGKFLINTSVIKTALKAIPIFGALPFGGLLSLSLIGVSAGSFFSSIDRHKALTNDKSRVKDKLALWERPLEAKEIQKRQLKYEGKIDRLQKEILAKEKQLKDGEEAAGTIPSSQTRLETIHRKALEQLSHSIEQEKAVLKTFENKKHQWKYLGKHLEQLDPVALQLYQKAKQAKWQTKFSKLEKENKGNLLSMVETVVMVVKQVVTITITLTGVGIVIIPFISLGMDLVSIGLTIANQSFQESAKKMKITPIKLEQYFKDSGESVC